MKTDDTIKNRFHVYFILYHVFFYRRRVKCFDRSITILQCAPLLVEKDIDIIKTKLSKIIQSRNKLRRDTLTHSISLCLARGDSDTVKYDNRRCHG